ncbi:hypothetical protein SAMN03159341_12259 [Paenibacillus sp. 1_12]|uniref:hypothetical protein n=1 Tax=Paenibacillus sp. 1_12 TaxID=1566278 RepID=UPI0008EBDB83|nr:hypothetical protein [Paenibacillus sp. 1_12]SFM25276.1 hypothetical protein SAMN03159341_12259 [Paenibacillus sp. 1_12]
MKIKLAPSIQEGIHEAEIIKCKIEDNGKILKVTFKLGNGTSLPKSYYISTEGGLAALTVLVKTCLGDIQDFEPEGLIGCRARIVLKREDIKGNIYNNIKKVMPFLDNEISDNSGGFEEDSEAEDMDDDFELEEESDDSDDSGELEDFDINDDFVEGDAISQPQSRRRRR